MKDKKFKFAIIIFAVTAIIAALYISISNISSVDECHKKIGADVGLPYYNKGRACEKIGDYKKAAEAYKTAINKSPNLASAYYNLGLLYLNLGNRKAAMDQYSILKGIPGKPAAEMADKLFAHINK